MNLAQILRLTGTDLVAQSLESILRDVTLGLEPMKPEHTKLIADVLLNDPDIMPRLSSLTRRTVMGAEIQRDLLSELWTILPDPASRHRIQSIATELGVTLPEHTDTTQAPPYLTSSQQAAFDELVDLTELYFLRGLERSGTKLRISPLLIGPSGAGKTHLLAQVSRKLDIPLLRMTVGDWIIRAARQEPCAFQILQDKLTESSRLILFIDELDKLSISKDGGGYSLHQQVEIYSVLDRAVSYPGDSGKAWTRQHAGKLTHSVMIVGGGTWHDLWKTPASGALGFGASAPQQVDMPAQIRKAHIIPDELLNRFSDHWLLLHPYTINDFRAIARHLGLSRTDFDPEAAAASGGNFRAVENALTRLALKQHRAAKSSLTASVRVTP